MLLYLWFLWLPLRSVRGTVRDAASGEALARVRVEVVEAHRQALTDSRGTFHLTGLLAGEYHLRFWTVGYRLTQTRVAGDTELEVALSPDSFHRTERVEVRADPFQADGRPTGFGITGAESKNLASVLADDPLRAVQAAPGVSSNDDFDSRFSIHGAPYERVGLYLDDVLLHAPFHTVQGEGPSGSMAVFNGDMIQEMTLESEGYATRYGDRTAGVLDVRTREGNRTQPNFRISAGAPDAGLLGEGPLGGPRGSWLASVRKSYLQYLMQRTAGDQPAMAFGFMDSQARLSYDLTRRQNLRLSLLDGTSDLDRSRWQSQLGLNASMLAHYHFSLAEAMWQYAPAANLVVNAHGAFLRERYDDTNRNAGALGEGFYGEWTAGGNAVWQWAKHGTLDFGGTARKIRGSGFSDYFNDPINRARVEQSSGGTLLAGGYAQPSWKLAAGHVSVSAGVRWDRLSASGIATTSPQASLALLPRAGTTLQFSWGQYAQFADVAQLFSIYGNPRLAPERATHYVATWEQRLGSLARLRVEAYRREDRDLLFRPDLEARLRNGRIVPDNFLAPIRNSVSGNAKGLEFFLQRRTANRLTGWVSYSLGYTRLRDAVSGMVFPADQDQRHTANVYLGYRLRPSVNLSLKWLYGSGFPAPGYFQQRGTQYYLAARRNGARFGPYQRTDLRISKARAFDRWKMTIYGEVANVFNRSNYRFDSYNGYDPASGRADLSFAKLFPVLPAAGIMLEF